MGTLEGVGGGGAGGVASVRTTQTQTRPLLHPVLGLISFKLPPDKQTHPPAAEVMVICLRRFWLYLIFRRG